jgi:glycosyltransferase involved in cell wall biosynthesis
MPEQQPLRVALLGAFPPQAQGIQDYCRELGESLSEHCEVQAIGFRRMYPARLFPGVKEPMDHSKAPMRGRLLHLKHPLTWYNPIGWLWHALRTPCDVFHAQWWSLPLWPVTFVFIACMKLRRKPVVITLHNVLPHEGSRGFIAASRILCQMADRVLVHSAANYDQLIEHYGSPEDKARRVPLGVYMGSVQAPPKAEAAAALGLDPSRRYLLSFGTIRPYKGIDDLIEAFAQVAGEHPEADLLIAGKPWTDWEPYRARIAAHGLEGRIHTWLDYIPEERIRLYFGAADLVVLPYTHFDAQSGVGAVALPYRKPLIVSSVGGLPDWVDEQAEWIVPPCDPGALAERLRLFLDDPDGATARFQPIAARVLENVSWTSIAREHLRIYHDLHRSDSSAQRKV